MLRHRYRSCCFSFAVLWFLNPSQVTISITALFHTITAYVIVFQYQTRIFKTRLFFPLQFCDLWAPHKSLSVVLRRVRPAFPLVTPHRHSADPKTHRWPGEDGKKKDSDIAHRRWTKQTGRHLFRITVESVESHHHVVNVIDFSYGSRYNMVIFSEKCCKHLCIYIKNCEVRVSVSVVRVQSWICVPRFLLHDLYNILIYWRTVIM